MADIITIASADLEGLIVTAVKGAISQYKATEGYRKASIVPTGTKSRNPVEPLREDVNCNIDVPEGNERNKASTASTVNNNTADKDAAFRTVYDFYGDTDESGEDKDSYSSVKRDEAVAVAMTRNHEAMKALKNTTEDDLLNPDFYAGKFIDPDKADNILAALVTKIITLKPIPEQVERNRIVELLTESYTAQQYRTPHSTQLYLLANFILSDYMRCKHPDKASQDYSFHTKAQMINRAKREQLVEDFEVLADNITAKDKGIAKKRHTSDRFGDKQY